MSAALHIRLTAAGKRYNRDWIFKDFTLDLPPQSLIAITGSNGSGKSTLLQCIGGFQSLSTGRRIYQFAGNELSELRLYQHLSLATPYLDLPEAYTLNEMLDFHFKLKPQRQQFALEYWLHSAGLDAHLHKQLMHFSSGMKQRVKLLLAFGCQTSLVLLDEPTTNLDEHGFAWYQQLVNESLEYYPRTMVIASNQAHEYGFCTREIAVADYKS